MSAALAMLLFCNYSEQYRKIASSMLFFAHTSCFAKEILADALTNASIRRTSADISWL